MLTVEQDWLMNDGYKVPTQHQGEQSIQSTHSRKNEHLTDLVRLGGAMSRRGFIPKFTGELEAVCIMLII